MPNKYLTLFDKTSISLESPPFFLASQITIMSTGLPDGDYITFSQVKLSDDIIGSICGCEIIPTKIGIIEAKQRLMCNFCPCIPNGVPLNQPIKITNKNPILVLDAPIGGAIVAEYHGEGLATGEVTVWFTPTKMDNIPSSLRGCNDNAAAIPTYALPCGLLAFAPSDVRDPEATVEVRGCSFDKDSCVETGDGEVIFYLYPRPKPWASAPITSCSVCGTQGETVIGYAINSSYNNGACE